MRTEPTPHCEATELAALPHADRPRVRAFLVERGVIWAGCDRGLYRIEGGAARFLAAWAGQSIDALGSADDGVVVATRGGVHLCDARGESRRELTAPPGDTVTCVLEVEGRIWAGGRHNLYRAGSRGWVLVLAPAWAGEVAWLRTTERGLHLAIARSVLDGRPRLLLSRDRGHEWTCEWTGAVGDRVLAASRGRVVSAWRGDSAEDGTPPRPLTAAHLDRAGTLLSIRDAGLTMARRGHDPIEVSDPSIARASWIAPDGDRVVFAGEQGVHTFAPDTGALLDLTAAGDGPRVAGCLARLWNLGGDRFLVCGSHGSFVTADAGERWTRARGALDLFGLRRIFRAASGRLLGATCDELHASDDGGETWTPLPRPHEGPWPSELTGVAEAGGKLVWSHAGGLFVQGRGQPPRRIEVAGQRDVRDIVAGPGTTVLILCGDGTLFELDAGAEQIRIYARAAAGGSALLVLADELVILGSDRVQRVRGGVVELLPPPGGGGVDYAASGPFVVAFDRDRAWLARASELVWRSLDGWPVIERPRVALAASGAHALVTDGQRLWRLRVRGA